jgi:flagellar hook-associated protein 1
MSLFAALRSSAQTLQVYERAMVTMQNNVANASTPGYAKQVQQLAARPFDAAAGIVGGVIALPVASTRDEYAEAAVRKQLSSLGGWEQQVDSLGSLESNFDLTGDSGISGALSAFYKASATWSLTPNNAASRQSVVSSAQQVCDAFHEAGTTLATASADADTQLSALTDQVNLLAGTLRDYNVQRASSGNSDAGLDAGVFNTLEQLSELVNVSVLKQSDGSLSVMLNGRTPLVVGEFQFKIGLDLSVPQNPPPTYPSAPPTARILDSSGQDITAQVAEGRLGGLLSARNNVIAEIRGDGSQPGSLNILAKSFADRVNTLLTSGNVDNANPPMAGVALFSYDATNDATVAQTLTLADPVNAASGLAAIQPGPPVVSNGVALALANLGDSQDPLDKINNLTYAQYYGGIVSKIGSAVSKATNNQAIQQSMVSQARALRQQTSGVSLDEEAINLLTYQRAYQAAAKMITMLDELTQTAVDLLK